MLTNNDRQRAAYDAYFKEYENVVAGEHARHRPYTIEIWLTKCAGRDILEVGCGGGYVIRELLGSGISVKSYTGIDVSEEMVKDNIQSFRGHPNVNFLVDNAETLTRVPDASFDVAVSWGCLHHLERPEQAIQAVSRKLRSGGKFLAAEANRRHPAASFVGFYASLLGLNGRQIEALLEIRRRLSWSLMLRKETGYLKHHPGHPGKRTPDEYREILSAAGLTPVNVRCLYLNLFPAMVYTSSTTVFDLMVRLSGLFLRVERFRDVGTAILIEAEKHV